MQLHFKEVLQLGISQWKFPANISHKKHKTSFHNPFDTPPGNIKISYTVTREMIKESALFVPPLCKDKNKLHLPASAFRYIPKV